MVDQSTPREPEYIYKKTSRRTGVGYWYGDFRRYHDVGGGQEALVPAGLTIATSNKEEARILYAERLKHYKGVRTRQQAREAIRPRHMRLGPVAVEHLTHKGQFKTVATGTLERDEDSFKVLVRVLGNVPLSQINSNTLFAYVATRRSEAGTRKGSTTANQTIRNELHALSSLFQYAIDRGYIARNPVRSFTNKPPAPSEEAFFLTVELAAHLLDAAATLDLEAQPAYLASRWRGEAKRIGDARRDPVARALRQRARAMLPHKPAYPNLNKRIPFLEAVVATLLYTGGRISEVLGLRVSDIDFANGLVRIRPNGYRGLKRQRHRRAMKLWPPLAVLLRTHIARFELTDNDLLFPGRQGTMLSHFNRPLDLCVERAGLMDDRRITPHTLRHTFATMLLQTLVLGAEGEWAVRSSFDVAKQLGQKSAALVDKVYGHAVEAPVYRRTLTYEDQRRYPRAA